MSAIKVMLWTGGDAPNREAKLTVSVDYMNNFQAFWKPGFCGCEDCHPLVGTGETEQEAIEDYWASWAEKYE